MSIYVDDRAGEDDVSVLTHVTILDSAGVVQQSPGVT